MIQNHKLHFITLDEFSTIIGRNKRTLNNVLTSNRIRDNSRKVQLPPFKRVAQQFVLSSKDLEVWLDQLPAKNTPIHPHSDINN